MSGKVLCCFELREVVVTEELDACRKEPRGSNHSSLLFQVAVRCFMYDVCHLFSFLRGAAGGAGTYVKQTWAEGKGGAGIGGKGSVRHLQEPYTLLCQCRVCSQ